MQQQGKLGNAIPPRGFEQKMERENQRAGILKIRRTAHSESGQSAKGTVIEEKSKKHKSAKADCRDPGQSDHCINHLTHI